MFHYYIQYEFRLTELTGLLIIALFQYFFLAGTLHNQIKPLVKQTREKASNENWGKQRDDKWLIWMLLFCRYVSKIPSNVPKISGNETWSSTKSFRSSNSLMLPLMPPLEAAASFSSFGFSSMNSQSFENDLALKDKANYWMLIFIEKPLS